MAKPDSSHEQDIVRAQNDALRRWPDDLNTRKKQRSEFVGEVALKNAKIAQAKKEAGADATEKRLIEVYGYKPQTIKILLALLKLTAADRAATMRQLIKVSEDEVWIFPDLFDHGAIGVGSNDEPGAGALFDETAEGKRRGGATAQPRTVEAMAASNENAGTPGIPLDVAERQFEEFLAKNPPKAGRVAKATADEKARLIAQIEAAKQAIPDLPEAQPGETTAAMREANAASEEHIRAAAPPPPPEKPKRSNRKAAAAPPPPPLDDDEDEAGEPVPGTNHRPAALGTAPTTFQVG